MTIANCTERNSPFLTIRHRLLDSFEYVGRLFPKSFERIEKAVKSGGDRKVYVLFLGFNDKGYVGFSERVIGICAFVIILVDAVPLGPPEAIEQ